MTWISIVKSFILINLLYAKVWIIRNTKDFPIPGIDYLCRIWNNILEFWVLNPLQLCTCFDCVTILIWASLMSLVYTKRASSVLNYKSGTYNYYARSVSFHLFAYALSFGLNFVFASLVHLVQGYTIYYSIVAFYIYKLCI